MIDLEVAFEPPRFDFDNDGNFEELRFVLTKDIRLSHHTRTGFILGGSGSTLVDIVTDIYEGLDLGDVPSDGNNQGGFLDLGGGSHAVEVEAVVSAGSDDQWGTGDGGDLDMTGAHPVHQMQLLDRVLQLAEIDSRGPDDNYPDGHTGTLEVGLYEGDSGVFQALNVAVEEPQLTFDATQSSSTATVNINFIEAFDLAALGDDAAEDES